MLANVRSAASTSLKTRSNASFEPFRGSLKTNLVLGAKYSKFNSKSNYSSASHSSHAAVQFARSVFRPTAFEKSYKILQASHARRLTTSADHTEVKPVRLSAWARFNTFAQNHPLGTQVAIATVKTSLADIVVQTQVEGKDSIDWRRNLVFIVFGGGYLGFMQYGIYVLGYARIFKNMTEFCNQPMKAKLKNRKGIKDLFGQIALDFTFVQPFMYFPVYYSFKSLVDRDSQEAMQEYVWRNWSTNLIQDNFGMMAFWFPADIVIYSVPIHLRLPLNHFISFAWCMILSLYRGGVGESEEESGLEVIS